MNSNRMNAHRLLIPKGFTAARCGVQLPLLEPAVPVGEPLAVHMFTSREWKGGLVAVRHSGARLLVRRHGAGPPHIARRGAARWGVGWYVKRVVDSLIAAVALVLTAPIMALSALAIRREGRGPILYSQVRVGIDRRRPGSAPAAPSGGERRHRVGYGRPFRMYKLRSMVPEAEKGTGAVWCAERDPRITRVGNFLRHTHLDELPQLVNVLRGEMSIVGPRPERPEFVEKLADAIPGYCQRCVELPGITGLAQVQYRSDQDLETVRTKLLYDLHYIRNNGLLFDVKIMAATVGVMARAVVPDAPPAPRRTPTPPRVPARSAGY